MPPRQELCRNFQRGSCQYGDRCKFLHAAPQQSKPNNPFGFGMQNGSSFQGSNNQQQTPNPFGFGVQNNNQSRGGTDYASKTTNFKPFENKWIRPASLSNNTSSTTKQYGNQPQVAEHKCNDPELCKRVIMDDLKNEKPQWILSCYGHCRYGPCDTTGDISCEELRAVAYDDGKTGRSLQYIIERERSLVNSKLSEFQSLEQRTHTVSSFGGSFPTLSSSSSTPALGFNQFGQSLNTGPPPVYTFGQPIQSSNNQGQPMQFSNNQASHGMVANSSPFGAFGSSQFPQTPVQTSFTFGPPSSGNAEATAFAGAFSTFGSPSTLGNGSGMQNGFTPNMPSQPSINLQLNKITSGLDKNVDEGIWTKMWKAGEVPEEAPPDIYIH